MRVTNQMMSRSYMLNLNQHLAGLEKAQNEVSSGKQLTKPSDDPVNVSAVLKLHAKIKIDEQYTRNIEDGLLWLNTSENALNDTQNIVSRAKDIALLASNGTMNADDRKDMAIEVNQLLEQSLNLANTKSRDGYVFGGTWTGSNPYVTVKNAANEITAVNANGDISGQILRAIGDGEPVAVNLSGEGAFSGDQNVFQSLIELRDSLRANNITSINNSLENFNSSLTTLSEKISEIGSKSSYFSNRKDQLAADSTQLLQQLSSLEDTDLTKSIITLQQEQLAYQAALSVGSEALKTTLLNYLK